MIEESCHLQHAHWQHRELLSGELCDVFTAAAQPLSDRASRQEWFCYVYLHSIVMRSSHDALYIRQVMSILCCHDVPVDIKCNTP